jgi:hypothetical protein
MVGGGAGATVGGAVAATGGGGVAGTVGGDAAAVTIVGGGDGAASGAGDAVRDAVSDAGGGWCGFVPGAGAIAGAATSGCSATRCPPNHIVKPTPATNAIATPIPAQRVRRGGALDVPGNCDGVSWAASSLRSASRIELTTPRLAAR